MLEKEKLQSLELLRCPAHQWKGAEGCFRRKCTNLDMVSYSSPPLPASKENRILLLSPPLPLAYPSKFPVLLFFGIDSSAGRSEGEELLPRY